MKRLYLIVLMALGIALGSMAQTDALVVEQNNGLADILKVSANLRIENNTDGTISVKDGNNIVATYARADIKRIAFNDEKALIDSVERAALIALYNATDGANWTNNTNWCSDKPLSEWYGIETRERNVTSISLGSNNLKGEIPLEFGNLRELKSLSLYTNNLTGKITNTLSHLTKLELISIGYGKNNFEIKDFSWLSKMKELYYLSLGCLDLSNTNLADICEYKGLRSLDLRFCGLNGSIPKEIGNLKKLLSLDLKANHLTGEIPEEFGNLTLLNELHLSQNELTGEIPESFNNLTRLSTPNLLNNCEICENLLTGKIPETFLENPNWFQEWPWLLYENRNYNIEKDVYIPAPSFRVKDIDGNILDSKDIYQKNKYTVIFHWATWCPYSNAAMNDIIPLYEKYKDSGLEIIGYTYQEEEQTVRDYIGKKNINWNNFLSTKDNSLDYRSSFQLGSKGAGYPDNGTPEISVVNSNGRVVFIDCINKRSDLTSFLENKLGPGNDIEIYNSTDFSADGKTTLLQNATTSKDIKVVIMGDGFSDRMIANGTYDKTMKKAMEALFTTEPIKNFRDRFSVTSVTVVSKNELFSDTTQTALGCYNNINGIGGNHSKVFQYAKTAIGEEAMDDAIIIVVLNSELSIASKMGGICYMYSPENKNNWGSGASISYIPNISGVYNELSFDNVLSHEAVGHGFAKLGDEYINKEEPIPAASIEEYKAEFILGWWKNADFTNNPTEVKWREFISDARYADEGIGIYEGGLTYPSGVYRPTENSIMSSDDTDFNAPSRQAIWYRINKLTQGANWEGTYEDFVQFDKATYGAQASARRTQKQTEDSRIRRTEELRTAPPVVKTITWREEK